jgi:hypothetical protein
VVGVDSMVRIESLGVLFVLLRSTELKAPNGHRGLAQILERAALWLGSRSSEVCQASPRRASSLILPSSRKVSVLGNGVCSPGSRNVTYQTSRRTNCM